MVTAVSSVRRILQRGGGQELQKNFEEQRSESEIVPPKISPIFCPKLGEEQKKVFTQIWSDFLPKLWCRPKTNV